MNGLYSELLQIFHPDERRLNELVFSSMIISVIVFASVVFFYDTSTESTSPTSSQNSYAFNIAGRFRGKPSNGKPLQKQEQESGSEPDCWNMPEDETGREVGGRLVQAEEEHGPPLKGENCFRSRCGGWSITSRWLFWPWRRYGTRHGSATPPSVERISAVRRSSCRCTCTTAWRRASTRRCSSQSSPTWEETTLLKY